MYESPDNPASRPDIDGLFQKLARDYEPPFDPAAWQQMQQRLDQQHPRPYSQTRQLLLLLAVLFITGSQFQIDTNSGPARSVAAVMSADRPYPDVTHSPTQQPAVVARQTGKPARPETVSKVTSQPEPVANPNSLPNVRPEPVARPVAGATANQPVVSGRPSVTGFRQKESPRPTKPDRRLAMQQRPNRANTAMAPASLNTGAVPTLPPTRTRNRKTADALPPTERTNGPTQPEFRSTVAAVVTVADSSNRINTDSVAVAGPVVSPAPTNPVKPDSAVAVNPIAVPDTLAQTDSKPAPVTSRPIRQTGLSFMVVVSPDLTTVGLTNFAQPGTNYGLMLEYRFARRWRVQTGLIRSTKIYTAAGSQYKYPSTWKLDVPFESVAGRCQMLDLPLNVRFDVLTGKRPVTGNGATARLFVSAGVTTYIMLQETYDYVYENPADPRIVFWKWQGKTGRYNFSQANFSMGYERPIAGRWSVQAEPFLKIPIEQVGFFKVRLISTGIFLGLRYSL